VKVLVYPHELIIGGCPINAIDLAAAVVEEGHEALVYGIPGPLTEYIDAKGLPFIAAHPLRYRPAPTRIWEVARIAVRHRVDIIHGYEWPPCLDAYFGAHLLAGIPVVCTVLSMSLMPLVPASVPLIMGTRQLLDEAQRARGGRIALIEPPIDADLDHPSVDGTDFRLRHGIEPDEVLIAVVSRLAVDLKLDALVRAIDAVAELAERLPVRLIVVGTGDAAVELEARAGKANARLRRPVIQLQGPMLDPRPAYAAADIVLGMGSSALRGLAFGKAVVVQGEEGFSAVFEPATCEQFYGQGFYGLGDGQPGPRALQRQIERLATDRQLRARLGAFGRDVVVERYSLRSASRSLLDIYRDTLAQPPVARRLLVREAARMGGRALANEARLHRPSDKRARRSHHTAKLSAAAAP
jgi:L-malate glycosyltransferase